jgi:hypothetical protein
MGAELWEYTAPYDADSVKEIFLKHKAKILPLTPDWSSISITDAPVPDFFTLAALPEGVDLEDDGGDFYDEIERGTGYYYINYENKKPVSVHFFGYSCD